MIRNRANGKVYVGSAARSFKVRWREHQEALNKNRHHNRWLQNDWNKNGQKNFVFEIIACCSPEWCVAIEQIHLTKNIRDKNSYNMCPMAGSPSGRVVSGKTREKFREIARKRILSTESREKIRQALRKMWADPEYKKITISRMRAGITPEGIRRGNEKRKGRHVSEEVRAKISASHKAMVPEVRYKIDSGRWAGDARKRHSEMKKGIKPSAETRAKMSAKSTGHLVSQETREKIRKKTLLRWTDPKMRELMTRRPNGYSISVETRHKISLANKGKAAHNKGKPHSAEHKNKLKLAWVIRRARTNKNVSSG